MSHHSDDVEDTFAAGYMAGAKDGLRLRYTVGSELIRLGVEAWERFSARDPHASERLSPRTQGIQTGRMSHG